MVPKLKPKSKIEVEGAIFDWLSYYKIPLKIAFSLKAIIYFFKHYSNHLLVKIFGNLLVHFAIIIWCNNKIMKVCFFVRLFRGRLQVLMNTSSDDHYSKNIHYSPFVSHFLQNKLLQVSHQGVENWLILSLSSIKKIKNNSLWSTQHDPSGRVPPWTYSSPEYSSTPMYNPSSQIRYDFAAILNVMSDCDCDSSTMGIWNWD